MSANLVGADADELERIADTLRSAADDLNGHAVAVTVTIRSVAWVGGVARRFGSNWNSAHRPLIASSVQFVRDAATQLERNAAEQRRASQAIAVGLGSADRGGSSGSHGEPPRERSDDSDGLEQLLDRFDLAHEQVEIVAGLVDRLKDHGEVGKLIEVVTDDAFATFLAGAEHVIDAGSMVVDTIADFAEHPLLQFDERIVHSLADAAVRFGLDQGMEFAAEWMAGAATVALLPGFGAILAPLVAEIAGALAGELTEAAVAAIDGATDLVDVVADAAVVAYKNIKEVFGVVADVAAVAVAVVDGAIDLAGDAAGAVLEAGGLLVSSGTAVAAGVFGALNPFDEE